MKLFEHREFEQALVRAAERQRSKRINVDSDVAKH
jgi:hypothetical protein